MTILTFIIGIIFWLCIIGVIIVCINEEKKYTTMENKNIEYRLSTLEHFREEVNEIDRKHDNGLINDEQYQEELRKIDKKLYDYERKHRTELL